MRCVFCDRVTAGEFDGQDGPVVHFEPLNPVTPGHRLFVPTVHVALAGAAPAVTGRVFAAAARWADTQPDDYNLITSAGLAATQSVFHLHVHYVPRVEGDGLTLPWTGQVKPR